MQAEFGGRHGSGASGRREQVGNGAAEAGEEGASEDFGAGVEPGKGLVVSLAGGLAGGEDFDREVGRAFPKAFPKGLGGQSLAADERDVGAEHGVGVPRDEQHFSRMK